MASVWGCGAGLVLEETRAAMSRILKVRPRLARLVSKEHRLQAPHQNMGQGTILAAGPPNMCAQSTDKPQCCLNLVTRTCCRRLGAHAWPGDHMPSPA